MNVLLNTINKVKNFVDDISGFTSDIDVKLNRYVVDGHSIMGLFSLDLSQTLDVCIISDDQNEINDFYEIVKKYQVRED